MFNPQLSDDEQAEVLKRWWSENGKSIVGGIVLGLGAVLGWQGWGQYQQGQAEQASVEYERLLTALQQQETASAQELNSRLAQDYKGTPYDYFAALGLARKLVDNNELSAAAEQLRYAIAEADDDGMKQLAEARLARVLLAMDDLAGARALAQNRQGSAFAGEFAHVMGDILLAEGDAAGAHGAYRQALEANASNRRLLEMKLNETTPAS